MITDQDFVGFEDEFQKIRMSLVDGPKELDVVSLVGMPGNGKTTLAQKLYEDPSVRLHFDNRAWCTVSQLYRKKDVWKTLLCQVSGRGSEMVDDEDWIAERLAKSLKRRRYLIIIDDIWEIKPWNDLRRYLPKDNNGSRILVTTRHQDVAKQISPVISNMHSLRVFTERESYELLERKSGLKDNYQSEELKQVGHQIALSCKGLPLAIAIAGGHLKKTEKNVVEWKKVLAGLSSRILNDEDRPYRVMLEWSYNCLPKHLKPCFLYAGVLGAYKPVQVWKLKWLWIAEGLVCDDNFESLENQAEEYLLDLINRSLVIPTKQRAIGGVKELRMHDLLKDFCLELSEEQNFMHKIKDVSHVDETDGSQKVSSWLRRYDFQIVKPSCSSSGSGHHVRSLLSFPFDSSLEDALAAMNSLNFELLQVLDMSKGAQNGDIFDNIKFLTHLKYLAIGSFYSLSHHIPSSIASLSSLQTFILDGYVFDTINVPDSLWDIKSLRNVRVRAAHVRFEVESSRVEKSSFPENIENLSTPYFSTASDTEILRRMPRLQRLSCELGYIWDDSSNCQFTNLDFLTQLMSLKIKGEIVLGETLNQHAFYGEILKQHNFYFPSNLKKLSLTYCIISWDEISNLGRKLPNLEVLKMVSTGEGGTWTVMAGDFPNLRYLKIAFNHKITEWLATDESFPKLEQLHLGALFCLEEIPCCFEDVVCLRMITVDKCGRISLYDSATKIGKVQMEEILNEGFIVNLSGHPSPALLDFLQQSEAEASFVSPEIAQKEES